MVLEQVVAGFFVALWIGFIFGIIRAWSPKVALAIIVLIGFAVLASVFTAESVGEFSRSLNWAFIAGTLPGYAIGPLTGEIAYEEATR